MGFISTLMNPSNSHCNGTIRIPPEPKKNQNFNFSEKKIMAPGDFHLFHHLKKHLAGKKFDDDDEVQEEAMICLKGQAAGDTEAGSKT
jgi:hypothetical protein